MRQLIIMMSFLRWAKSSYTCILQGLLDCLMSTCLFSPLLLQLYMPFYVKKKWIIWYAFMCKMYWSIVKLQTMCLIHWIYCILTYVFPTTLCFSRQVVAELTHPDPAGSQSDFGLSPGGKVKLIKSSTIVLENPVRYLSQFVLINLFIPPSST